jgi:hypothetical protein
MTTMLSVTINAPPTNLPRQVSEVNYCIRLLNEVIKELGRGQGTVTSGAINSYDVTLNSPTSQGSWTYTSQATTP